MTWIYAMPAAVFFIATVVAMSFVSCVGLLVFLRFFPQHDELTHNDVAGPIIGAVGTIMAVVLSFMLIVNWQQYDAAGNTVQTEASAVADLYHLAQNMPEPVQSQVQKALRAYVGDVVDVEWPLMRTGGRSSTARDIVLSLIGTVSNYQPKTTAQQTIQQNALVLVQTLIDNRRLRLFDNSQGIPTFMWIGNVILAFVTISLCYLFRVRSRFAHMLMTLSLAIVISVIFVLTALVDYPFRGSTQIPPTLFQNLQQQFDSGSFTELD